MTIPAEQSDVAAYLTRLSGAEAKQTHISAVFIGADTVWKLKKAVRLPFLDFRAIEARHHFLQRELAINQPAAPSIYRDVVPIGRRPDGTLAIGEGESVDWVLRMAPVPRSDFLDVIAEHQGLTPALLDRLGDCVAAYHAGPKPVTDWDSAGGQAAIARGNAEAALEAGLPPVDVKLWTSRCLGAIDHLRDCLTARTAAGFVRRCHGDLHLGNLCLWDGKPTPFDALEFDESLATIDTAYDLAFLLMDLDLRVGRAAANRVMNRYVARTGDVGLAEALPVFLSQRAMVRAHVLARTNQPDVARERLKAALAYLSPSPGQVVAIGGLQGTGKTTLARALAPDLGPAPGALILRSDELRKRLFGYNPEQRLPAEAYSAGWNAVVNSTLIDQVRQAAATGQAVIADSTFLEPRMARDLVATGVALTGIWLRAPLAELERRVAARQGDASDATVGVLRRAAERDVVPAGWTEVDATDADEALQTARSYCGRTSQASGTRH